MKSTEYLILLGTEPAEVGDQTAGLRPRQTAGLRPRQTAGLRPRQTAGFTPYQTAGFQAVPDRWVSGRTRPLGFRPYQTAGFQAQQARVPSASLARPAGRFQIFTQPTRLRQLLSTTWQPARLK